MHKGERDNRYVVLLFTTACAHWRRVVGHASGCGSGCGSGRQYTVVCTLVCIHSAGGWSLLLTASRTTPPSLSSWGAEHNENPPTTSTPGIDTSNHCPAWKETAGLETFNSNHLTVGESCFTPTTVACDVTYVRTYVQRGGNKQLSTRTRRAQAAYQAQRVTGRCGDYAPGISARPTFSADGCCLALFLLNSPCNKRQSLAACVSSAVA